MEIEGQKNYKHDTYFEITSNDLLDQMGKALAKIMFTKINLLFIGSIIKDSTTIGFSCNVDYNHPSGGHNGITFYRGLWFDYETEKWTSEAVRYR